jgi:hypothetical protein
MPKTPRYSLRRVLTRKFEMLGDLEIDSINHEILKYSIDSGFGANDEKKLIQVKFGFTLVHDTVDLIKLETSLFFNIENYDEIIQKNEDKQSIVPHYFKKVILGIAISTSRGVLHSKTEGSYLNKFFIPIIDASAIIDRDFK